MSVKKIEPEDATKDTKEIENKSKWSKLVHFFTRDVLPYIFVIVFLLIYYISDIASTKVLIHLLGK